MATCIPRVDGLSTDPLRSGRHTVVGPPFRYRECIGKRRFDEAVITKEADMWL